MLFEADFGSQQASGDEDQDDLSNSKTFERLVQLSELEDEVSYAGSFPITFWKMLICQWFVINVDLF